MEVPDPDRKHRRRALIMLPAVLCALGIGAGSADEDAAAAELRLKPDRCVALHQGQVCYQHTKISWQTSKSGRYCIFWELSGSPLQCWEDASEGSIQYDFQSSETVRFTLQAMPDGDEQASTDMSVAWVYKARKRQRLNWRLF